MSTQVQKIKVFVASPSDVNHERQAVQAAITEVNSTIGDRLDATLQFVGWETITPRISGKHPQEIINDEVGIYDIFIGIMWKHFGTPTPTAASGTEDEFLGAYKMLEYNDKLHILFYFCDRGYSPNTAEECEQLRRVYEFRDRVQSLGLARTYENVPEFTSLIRKHLTDSLHRLADDESSKDHERIIDGDTVEVKDIADPSDVQRLLIDERQGLYSSFQPVPKSSFLRLHLHTTHGYIGNEQTRNDVYIIKDPIRPFDIQIGRTRSQRKAGSPQVMPALTSLSIGRLRQMYPFIHNDDYKWVRMVLAELVTEPDILAFLYENDEDTDVKNIVSKNPSAPDTLKQKACLFCNQSFLELRAHTMSDHEICIIRNDFPYGPYFHYIVMPTDPVHSWEEIGKDHLRNMNRKIWSFLNQEQDHGRLRAAAGLFIGFNSTIRHLVLGKNTRTSAGASIGHVHKQIWGMARGSVNLGNHTAKICAAYNADDVDYLAAYLDALRDAGLMIHEDEHVALYVPFGQISKHELQVMIKRPSHHYFDLEEEEVEALSKAEYYVTRFYQLIGINSFNEVVLLEPFDKKTPGFRMIMTFITREVDLAVSELNQLYVVDHQPEDTARAISSFKDAVLNH